MKIGTSEKRSRGIGVEIEASFFASLDVQDAMDVRQPESMKRLENLEFLLLLGDFVETQDPFLLCREGLWLSLPALVFSFFHLPFSLSRLSCIHVVIECRRAEYQRLSDNGVDE
jgi:hypothetical protein